jgi:hypothetical protein
MSDPKFWARCHPWPLLILKHKVNITVKILRHRRGRGSWGTIPLSGPILSFGRSSCSPFTWNSQAEGAPKLASLVSEVKSWMWNFQSCTFSYSMERCPNIQSLNMRRFLLLEVVIISLPLSRCMTKTSLIFMIFIHEYKVPSKYTSKISRSALMVNWRLQSKSQPKTHKIFYLLIREGVQDWCLGLPIVELPWLGNSAIQEDN